MKRLIIGIAAMAAAVSIAAAQQANAPAGPPPDAANIGNNRSLLPKRQKAPTSRTVSGQVVDANGQPLEGALVTLTNMATKEKREFFTKKGGRYTFEDLSFTIDYQLQARYKDSNGELKKLSQYDKSPKMVRILQIDTGTQAEPAAEAKKNPPPAKS
jgi:phosphate-selective porin